MLKGSEISPILHTPHFIIAKKNLDGGKACLLMAEKVAEGKMGLPNYDVPHPYPEPEIAFARGKRERRKVVHP